MKFKVGDRVKFPEGTLLSMYSTINPENDTGVIIGIDWTGMYEVKWPNGTSHKYQGRWLELEEEILYEI